MSKSLVSGANRDGRREGDNIIISLSLSLLYPARLASTLNLPSLGFAVPWRGKRP